MAATIDCEIPAPHISGLVWRPSSCNGIPAIIQVIEAITTYICDNIAPAEETGNNNFRVVPGGTSEGDFNDEFYLTVPAEQAVVYEGNNIWWTVDNGANWDILEISAFQVGTAGSFADPDNPTPLELRTLFPQALPANNALVFNTYNDAFYNTDDAGVTWGEVDYVKTTGDTMTGPLVIDITEVDLVSDLNELSINGNHVLTANTGQAMNGISVATVLNSNSFDSPGSEGITVNVSNDGDAGSLVDVLAGVTAQVEKFGGAGVVTNAIGIQVAAGADSSTGSITNLYGLYVAPQTAGVANHAIFTNTGLNRFGDQVKIIGNQDVPQLWVVGDNAQTNPIVEVDDSASNAMFYILPDGEINILPRNTAGDGGGTPFYIETPARTAMTASIEQSGVWFDVTPTKQWATGALTNQREIMIERPTYAFVGASTITNAATVYIENAPAAGTNATITNAYALWVDDGAVRLDGTLEHNGSLVGLYGVAPVAQSATYGGITNVTTDRTYDANSTSLDEIADVLGTLIADLRLVGVIG